LLPPDGDRGMPLRLARNPRPAPRSGLETVSFRVARATLPDRRYTQPAAPLRFPRWPLRGRRLA